MDIREQAYQSAKKRGFHERAYSDEHYTTLIISELTEAVEADRKGKRANVISFENHSGLMEFKERYEAFIKDSVEDELADACIRIYDFAGATGKNAALCRTKIDECKTLPEHVYDVIKTLMTSGSLSKAISKIYKISKLLGISLFYFIDRKMEYNETREYKHGKRY